VRTYRCIKWDPLCGRLPKALTSLDLTVIEGVLQLFADWGTTALLAPRSSNGTSGAAASEYKWCQVLGPGLCGYMHACDPNVVLVATPENSKELDAACHFRLRLVTTKPISKGQVLTCHYGGYAGLPSHAFGKACGDAIGEELEDEQQAAEELLQTLAGLSVRSVDRDTVHKGAGICSIGAKDEADFRVALCKLASWVTGDHWVSNACRAVLLSHGACVQLHSAVALSRLLIRLPCARC
jgi:hypothetical protein